MAIGRIPEPGTGIPESIIAAKGDLIAGTANDTPGILTAGSNETRLVADSSTATGLKYVADTTNYAIAAKGDLLVGTGADTLAALTVGTNGHTLVADSSTATGLKWAAPSGDWVKITEIVNTSTAAFSFTSIPSTYRNLVIIGQGRSNLNNTFGTGLMRFNGDTGNNYDWVAKQDGIGVSGNTGAGQSYCAPFMTVASTATANNSFSWHITIPNYKGTTFFKTYNAISGAIYNTTAGDFKVFTSSGLWRSTSAITSIELNDASGGGGFISGSVCTLYGVM